MKKPRDPELARILNALRRILAGRKPRENRPKPDGKPTLRIRPKN